MKLDDVRVLLDGLRDDVPLDRGLRILLADVIEQLVARSASTFMSGGCEPWEEEYDTKKYKSELDVGPIIFDDDVILTSLLSGEPGRNILGDERDAEESTETDDSN